MKTSAYGPPKEKFLWGFGKGRQCIGCILPQIPCFAWVWDGGQSVLWFRTDSENPWPGPLMVWTSSHLIAWCSNVCLILSLHCYGMLNVLLIALTALSWTQVTTVYLHQPNELQAWVRQSALNILVHSCLALNILPPCSMVEGAGGVLVWASEIFTFCV